MIGAGQPRTATRTRQWTAAIVGVGTLASIYCRDAHSGLKAGGHGTTGTGRAMTTGPGLRQGPFKILVLSTTLEYHHEAIPTGLQMLRELGKATAPERATIPELAGDATWTVEEIGSDPAKPGYFSEVSPENLAHYELFFSNNPTGPVFTKAPHSGEKKQAFVDYWAKGGSWAGLHSATDFEKDGQWSWFQDNIDGGWFVGHDDHTTHGVVSWQPEHANHPILKGLTSPWNVVDEWYVVHRNVEALKGFRVIANVTVKGSSLGSGPRPAVWITENANGKGGRAFYTVRGHNLSVYAEPEFRALMLRGILWAVHRLPGGA